jgi:V/A-type H+-transporting ATPase subunit D
MAKMRVSATRMELMRVRRRLAAATRGHALLKDKLDGLMSEFLSLIARYKAARRAFDREFPQVCRRFVLADLCAPAGAVTAALSQSRGQLELTVERQNLSGVNVPRFTVQVHPAPGYSLLETPLDLDEALEHLRVFFPRVVELAELEHAIWMFIADIERTRRRVNALEYVMIPGLRDAMHYIRTKLEEIERSNTVRLMKIKEMRLAQQRQAFAESRQRD